MEQEYYYGKQKKYLSSWAYVGLRILFFIPVIGFIFLIIFTFNNRNINRRNYARSYWIHFLIFILFICLSSYLLKSLPVVQEFYDLVEEYVDIIKSPERGIPDRTANTSSSNAINSSNQNTAIGVTPDLKEVMDDYEAFMDEYVNFLNTYDENNLSDLTRFIEISAKEVEWMQKIDNLDDSSFTTADVLYYEAVCLRVANKLLSVSK